MLLEFIKQNKNYLDKRFLVAVSGGVDSMVLLELMIKTKCYIEVAHVDHSTRNDQSKADALFVEKYCAIVGIPFHQKVFTYESGNFQDQARTFRKSFFSQVLEKRNLDLIATAHHIDDVIEGYLLASFRGSHLNRLITPKYQEERYIRPLYFFEKEEILDFAKTNEINYVQDESNYENHYSRNYYRNEILPQIFSHTVQGKSGIKKTIEKISNDNNLLQKFITQLKYNIVTHSKGSILIDIDYLFNHELLEVLSHFLFEYGFSEDQILKIPFSKTGSLFESADYSAVKDRSNLIITKSKNTSHKQLIITEPGRYIFGNKTINIQQLTESTSENQKSNEQIVAIESNEFSVVIRNLNQGDRIKPIKLKGKSTKISKALTDLKIDRISKQKTMIIEYHNEIIWAYPYIRGYKSINFEPEKWLKITIDEDL